MNITRAEYERMTNRTTPVKRRKKPGTGDLAQRKAWLCAMMREPGIFIPIRTMTEANTGGHWAAKAKRADTQRQTAWMACVGAVNAMEWHGPNYRVRVTLTRYAPGTLDDDNVRSALKHLRDGIQDAFGIDDKSKFYEWVYAPQVKTKAGQYGVRVLLEPLTEGA